MRGKLSVIHSANCSGKIYGENGIETLNEEDYVIKLYALVGDAPKNFLKVYFFTPNSTVRKSSPDSWPSFIAKSAEKWYPHESIVEYTINRIGQIIGLRMNEIKLVRINGQIRFLSKYFLKKDEKLIHGAEICGEHLGDMKLAEEIANNKDTSRDFFTFEFVKDAMRSVFPNSFELLMLDFVRMLTFDALTGNNDRHYYNWGIIDSKKKRSKLPIFTPIYDSARGLLWNKSDDSIKHMFANPGKKIEKYINNACPRVSIENNSSANHFELMDFLKRYDSEFKRIICDLSHEKNEAKVLKMLEREIFPYFIKERCELIKIILQKRFKKIRSIVYEY